MPVRFYCVPAHGARCATEVSNVSGANAPGLGRGLIKLDAEEAEAVAVTGDAMTGQPTALPTRKVASGGLASTMAVLLIWLYDTCGLPGAPVPPETAAALTAMTAFAVSYAVPPASIETVLPDEDEVAMRHFG